MTVFAEDLRTFILGTTTVSNVVGTRCHSNMMPQTSAEPRIWFRITGDTEERTFDGAGGLHEVFADIESVASSESVAQTLGDAIKTRLDGYRGAAGNSTVQGMFVRDKGDDYAPFSNQSDEGLHVVACNLHAWYTT